jgi:FtsP/CotA-like multicopper oxidase with cupredoxin domain
MRRIKMLRTSCLVLLLAGCDAAPTEDPAVDDAAALDGAALDATPLDAAPDAAPLDAAPLDAAPDAALPPPLPSLEGPAVAPDLDPDPRVVEIELRASAARYRLGADLEIDGLAYNGQSPGPTIQARVGDELVVRFKNDLDGGHHHPLARPANPRRHGRQPPHPGPGPAG